jgi:hypothetical protein
MQEETADVYIKMQTWQKYSHTFVPTKYVYTHTRARAHFSRRIFIVAQDD